MHPVIRAKVRDIVKRIAIVSTEPTEAGEQMLTPFHKYGSIKRIRNKPVLDMLGAFDQFLFMVAAEKEGLIKVRYECTVGRFLLTTSESGSAAPLFAWNTHLASRTGQSESSSSQYALC